ncbi:MULTISPECIES: class I SAM-dependent methyltransferase [Pseudomonas]|jgi:SAM-dependent methyltransferase|uniref:SAM-dependent methyltransferase n=1 Tax=Pseudomonas putida TaxID=303 RepID=A0A7U6M3F4_PSEPU|nr:MULTISPECIES: class I SAM-dependent methyltransferase [Pseudomonas]MBB3273359.1 SAM-dependent methyltransferase [Pseudomonas sp. OG7]MBH3397501.1 methyltransferase domain-containing protein [Pseudomonas monteilii]MCJ7852792.1 methyltransferase domain-containing protein [Pseudomonas monteilii]MDD2124467.1 methyltransferase domain-containing protein [Pseudomonas monteilii]MDI3369360.1 class I SAM-dependent methyltransferase [Pseudomonas sp. V104_10]
MDEARLHDFMGKLVGDMGAAATLANVILGDELGLYRALADSQPTTPEALAAKTGCHPRLVREWLNAQAASGYMTHDKGLFVLPEEQAMALALEDSPAYMAGGAAVIAALFHDKDKLVAAMRGDGGLAWGDHHPCMFSGTERFFRPGYRTFLVAEWLPALEGVVAKLQAGAKVADVGCGHGASTLVMAQAFPASTFVGYDYHGPSITTANERAREAGLSERVNFQQASAKDYPGHDHDLVCFFDCLHDMGDPVGAARHAYRALKPDGTVMLVEPYAEDSLDGNLNPVGRLFYAASTFICTPNSLSQEVGLGLGAQAGEGRLRAVFEAAGFSRFRRATQTPFNLILEARK